MALCAALFLGAFTGVAAAEPQSVFRLYKLPKGLNWGQSEAEVITILQRERATITKKEGDATAEVWEIKGLFMSNLDSASFTMIDRKLEGVELRYGNPKWSERKARGVFDDFRILSEHNLGKPADSHRENTNQGGILETTEALEWRVGDEVARLVYFSAAQGKDEFRLVSLHLTRRQGEEAMQAIAEANAIPELKDPPGAGGPGETLFLVEPDLPDPGVAGMNGEGLPADLFSEKNLQAGTAADPVKEETDALAIAAEAAAQVDKEATAAATATAAAETEPTVAEDQAAAGQAAQALVEMAAEQDAQENAPAPATEPAPKSGADAADAADAAPAEAAQPAAEEAEKPAEPSAPPSAEAAEPDSPAGPAMVNTSPAP